MNKRILTIAGSDSGGGAGIQIDIKTAWQIGCDSSTVITAVTAQNLSEVRSVEQLSLAIIEGQFRAVMDEIEVDALKIGMLASREIAHLIGRLLQEYKPRYVVADPVLVATSGGVLGGDGVKDAILESIVPQCTLLTPNIDEAEKLCKLERGAIKSQSDCDAVWQQLKGYGLQALLLKGGHAARWQGEDKIVDMLYSDALGRRDYLAQRVQIEECKTHGTGCTLSSAVASYLALGCEIEEAVGSGVRFVQQKLLAL